MFQPLHTGGSGLIGQQRSIDTIGNNLSNLSTTGYKKVRLDFQDLLYTRMFNWDDNGPHMNLQRGAGIREYQTARVMTQGAAQVTERTLDFMLEGAGFFAVENPTPMDEDGLDETLYTRVGSFYISAEEVPYLIDGQGRYILDADGERIAVTDPANLAADSEGNLFYTSGDGQTTHVARLGLYDFVNPGGLADVGDGYFVQTANSGEISEAACTVRQGVIEASNVDMSEEMVRLIRSQRAYQLAARCVSTADQMMQIANSIKS